MAREDPCIIRPFRIAIPEADLQDLRHRLALTRWPEDATVEDWSQGVPLSDAKKLCRYWADEYDWRVCERYLNSYPQFVTEIYGVDIHFLHIKSHESSALPMLMTHGWPGSILEFRRVIEPLVNPVQHGGKPSDGFHLILPSLPGYGFSGKPDSKGWDLAKIAGAWEQLMARLGYGYWVAQGGDWGADIAAVLASETRPPSLAGVHMNTAFFNCDKEITAGSPITADEQRATRLQKAFEEHEYGYFKQQATRPQTIGYGLADSPALQACWIYEKISSWVQHGGVVTEVIPIEEILDNIMLYWLPNVGTSSARLYWEATDGIDVPIDLPVGLSIFPGDLVSAPRAWGEKYYTDIVHWRNVEKGGHFAAWEVPELFVREVRDCFRHIRERQRKLAKYTT